MQTYKDTYREHYRALTTLGVPIVFGQVGNILLGFADTLMIGHHSMIELAAASFINTMLTLVIIFSQGFSMGLTPLVGNAFGRGEHQKTGQILRSALSANSVLALVLLAVMAVFYSCLGLMGQPAELLPYMRPYLIVNILSIPFICWLNTFKQFFDAITMTKVSMYVLLTGNIMNIGANYLLIYGPGPMPELGLVGAGIATLFSRIFMVCCFVAMLWRKRFVTYRKALAQSTTERSVFNRLNALGWPLAFQLGMETAAFSLTAVIVGWIGTTALAAHQIMLTISQLFYMVYYGMAAAIAVRVSHFAGTGNLAAISHTSKAGFHLILAIAFTIAIPVFLLRNHMGAWFTDDPEVCTSVANTVIILIIYQFGDGLQCTYANALRGVSCVKPMMYIAFFSYFIISLPLSYIFGIRLGLGLPGIWAAFPVCLTCAGLLYYIAFRHHLRRMAHGA